MKRIGITSGHVYDGNYLFKGYPRLATNQDYSRSILQAGGVPVLLPVIDNYEVVKEQVKMVDAILLTGGQDVQPHLYYQEPHPLLQEVSKERDIFEYQVIQAAIELNKPIMGICRGLQILNVYFGGTLYQDNTLKGGELLQHVQMNNPNLAMHHVNVDENSHLFEAVQRERFMVNTFHHQSIKDVANNFKVVARADDGIIEAIQSHEYPIFAVQWHPEMLSHTCEHAQALFYYYIHKFI